MSIKNFRFWAQKVLPTTYDESLSYYEVLCKLRDKLNEVIDAVNDMDPGAFANTFREILEPDEGVTEVYSATGDEQGSIGVSGTTGNLTRTDYVASEIEDAVTDATDDMTEYVDGKIQDVNEDIGGLDTRLDAAEGDIDDLEGDVTALQTAVDSRVPLAPAVYPDISNSVYAKINGTPAVLNTTKGNSLASTDVIADKDYVDDAVAAIPTASTYYLHKLTLQGYAGTTRAWIYAFYISTSADAIATTFSQNILTPDALYVTLRDGTYPVTIYRTRVTVESAEQITFDEAYPSTTTSGNDTLNCYRVAYYDADGINNTSYAEPFNWSYQDTAYEVTTP